MRNLTRYRSGNAGFTLMELMITVAIVAILASIAYPSYVEYTRRSERANARAAMTSAAQWMERQFTTNNVYPAALSGLDTSKYNLSLQARTTTTYIMQASVYGGWADPKCGTLTLTNTGVQGSGGTESTTYCWTK